MVVSSTPLALEDTSTKRSADAAGLDNETEQEKKKRLLVEKALKDEEDKIKKSEEKAQQKLKLMEERQRQREDAKQARKLQQATPEGRGRTWINGLQEYITRCDDEGAHCRSSDCDLPPGLAKEYATTWQVKANHFKKLRSQIEKILSGEKSKDGFKEFMDKCERELKEFKGDLQRYKILERGYNKQKQKQQQAATAETE